MIMQPGLHPSQCAVCSLIKEVEIIAVCTYVCLRVMNECAGTSVL